MENETKFITSKIDADFINEFRKKLADEWEEAVTGVQANIDQEKLDYVEKIRRGKKLPKDIELLSKIARIGQDYGLNPDEIQQLENILTE